MLLPAEFSGIRYTQYARHLTPSAPATPPSQPVADLPIAVEADAMEM